MQPGIPDIIACVNGRFVGIEVKNKGKLKNQSEQQKIHEQLIKESGGLFILADSLQTVKDSICQNINTFYS
jgi:Holliday junction resolvase